MAWMKNYNGITSDDYPINGGAFIQENGYGHEVFNFQKNGKYVYGYVQAKNATINIDRIGGQEADFIDGVFVFWRARSNTGSVVVGWYRNARVYRNEQQGNARRILQHEGENHRIGYLIRAEVTDAFLVPIQHRNFHVPITHKGFGSQTFVSFLDQEIDEVNRFRTALLAYADEAENGNFVPPNRGHRGLIDTETKTTIEHSAIDAAIEYYLDQGYDVSSVESENVGYDLIAVKGRKELHIEVKGTSSAQLAEISVTLTPNEYLASVKNCKGYRIVIVYNALEEPCLLEFYWVSEDQAWFSDQSLTYLSITEVTSARLSIANG